MKKMKFDFAKFNALLLKHVEKIVLGVVVLVAAYIVYMGWSLPGFDGQAPDSLLKLGETSTSYIRNPKAWEEMEKQRYVDPKELDEQLKKAVSPNIDSAYRLPMPWKKPDFPRLAPRVDPQLFAPIHLKVVPMQGPLAYLDENVGTGEYGGGSLLTKTIDPLDPVQGEEPEKPKKKPKKKRPTNREGSPYSEDDLAMMEGSPSGPSGYPTGEGGMASNIAGMLYPEAQRGFRPTGQAVAKPGQAMVVMALVPYEKQIEEYEKALSESLDYDPMRDSPRYLLFHVQRADVTDNPNDPPAEEAWTSLSVKGAVAEMANWAGAPSEILDPTYLDPIPNAITGGTGGGGYSPPPMMQPGGSGGMSTPSHNFGVLTHPAPPFLLRDTWEMLTHPEVPLLKLMSQTGSEYGPDGRPRRPRDPVGPAADAGEDLPGLPFQPGMGGMGEGGYNPYPTAPGSMGSGGYGYEGMGGVVDPTIRPKYKLIRFTDMTVESGRKYCYRLRVFLEDPNYPSPYFKSPPPVSMSDEVQNRVKRQAAADAQKVTKTAPNYKTYWRFSDWSEASTPAELPPTETFLAVSADPPAMSTILPDRPGVPSGQASATMLTVMWDPAKAADLAAETKVFRGSMVSFVKEAYAVHPTKMELRSLPNIEFRTNSIVADIQGGDSIPAVKRASDTLKMPAQVLVFDTAGNFRVEDDTLDIEEIRMYTPMPEPEKTDPMAEGYTGEGASGYDDLMRGPGPVRQPRRQRGSP